MTDKTHTDVLLEDVRRRLMIEGDVARIVRQQELSPAYLDQLARERDFQDARPIGNYHKVASVPTVIAEKWLAEGFNVYDPNVTADQILARLRNEEADRLITTSRKI